MTFYWIMFLTPLLGALFPGRSSRHVHALSWFVLFLVFSVIIGFRYRVGGDWDTYIVHLEYKGARSFFDIISGGDPGYYLLNYFVNRLDAGIQWVNFACGLIFMAGVVRFSREQPLPWLALLVAVPYLIIVVGMGYTRQSAALGFLLLGLVSLSYQRTFWFVVFVLLGATFHKSSVLLLPVAALASTHNRLWNLFWVALVSVLAAYFFVFDAAADLWAAYIDSQYESEGGLVRVLMNVVPGGIFLCLNRYLNMPERERRLWFWMSIIALACVPLVLVSSTATDRVALYLIPLQLYVFARIHLITNDLALRSSIVILVVLYYGVVQLTWLLFANNAQHWLPYQMVWFVP